MEPNVFDQKIDEFNAMAKLTKYQIIARAEEAYAEDAKFKPIYDEFSEDKRIYVEEITNVNDKYQIVRVKCKRANQKSEILYYIYIGFKRTNTAAYSFDEAMIEAIAMYHHMDQAGMWIARMLGVKSEPEYAE